MLGEEIEVLGEETEVLGGGLAPFVDATTESGVVELESEVDTPEVDVGDVDGELAMVERKTNIEPHREKVATGEIKGKAPFL